MRVRDVRPWAGNPREHTAEQLRLIQKSIAAHGLVALPVVQKGTNRLLAGHGRLQALLDAGHGDAVIPVIVADMDDRGATAYTVADNRLENPALVDPITHKREHSDCVLVDGVWWKLCEKCSQRKPESDFYFYPGHNGLYYKCKACASADAVAVKRRRRSCLKPGEGAQP